VEVNFEVTRPRASFPEFDAWHFLFATPANLVTTLFMKSKKLFAYL
jgi:hypothetical protein